MVRQIVVLSPTYKVTSRRAPSRTCSRSRSWRLEWVLLSWQHVLCHSTWERTSNHQAPSTPSLKVSPSPRLWTPNSCASLRHSHVTKRVLPLMTPSWLTTHLSMVQTTSPMNALPMNKPTGRTYNSLPKNSNRQSLIWRVSKPLNSALSFTRMTHPSNPNAWQLTTEYCHWVCIRQSTNCTTSSFRDTLSSSMLLPQRGHLPTYRVWCTMTPLWKLWLTHSSLSKWDTGDQEWRHWGETQRVCLHPDELHHHCVLHLHCLDDHRIIPGSLCGHEGTGKQILTKQNALEDHSHWRVEAD